MAKNTKPTIRFKGFTDAWEQRKLSSLCEKFTDGDWIEAKDQSDSGVRLIQTGNVGVTEYLDKPNNKKWVTADTFERLRCEEVLPGDILISRLPEPAGRACIMPNLGTKMITAVDCTIVRTFAEYSSKFLVQFLSTHDYFNEVNTALAGGTRQRISRSNLASFDVPTPPTFEEQEAIGNYFKHLDHLITLHQRKYDSLVNVKKAMLEKMFPKNGETVPEIRFKGFTDAWEQRKLGDYLDVSSEKNTSNIYNKGDVLSVSGDYGIVNQIEFQGRSFAGASVSNYGVVHTGDVVYTKSPLNSNPYGIIKANKGKTGIVSTLYAVYRPKENAHSDFVQTYFEQHARMNNYMHPLVNKGAKNDMKVSSENALKGYVTFPKYEEQKMIFDYFSVIDHLITLHQRKLEKLKNIKKSCLEKMFV